MELSYWEYKTWLTDVDFTVVGSGIIGLNCALQLRQRFPKSKILVLEKGLMPQGGSTKNAGFACFGSLSEIVTDLKIHSEEEVFQLVERRYKGLALLRQNLGDGIIDYRGLGGYELFLENDIELYEECREKQSSINTLLRPLFNKDVFSWQPNQFHFKRIKSNYAFNSFEGQIDTGKMMAALLHKVHKAGIKLLNNCEVKAYSEHNQGVVIKTKGFSFSTQQLLIATNGFASQLVPNKVTPARAQVLITKPISNLHIKGTFHLDRGFYYFRNIDNRILFGGGRNLDFKNEETIHFGLTERIQNKLEELLKTVILPNWDVEVEHRWSGIMGVGHQKSPVIQSLGNRVHCGVRLGGMGVSIGSLVGKELADLVS
jgi:gamma-glutamylputrescine oxidase